MSQPGTGREDTHTTGQADQTIVIERVTEWTNHTTNLLIEPKELNRVVQPMYKPKQVDLDQSIQDGKVRPNA